MAKMKNKKRRSTFIKVPKTFPSGKPIPKRLQIKLRREIRAVQLTRKRIRRK